MPDDTPRPAPLHLVRIALTASVLLIGVIFWWLRGQQDDPFMLPEDGLRVLQIAFLALLVGGAVVLLVLRRRIDAGVPPQQGASLRLIGWAAADGLAVLGAVYLLFTGSFTFYGIGLLMLLTAFLLLPAS